MFAYFIVGVICLTAGYFFGVGLTMFAINNEADNWAYRKGCSSDPDWKDLKEVINLKRI